MPRPPLALDTALELLLHDHPDLSGLPLAELRPFGLGWWTGLHCAAPAVLTRAALALGLPATQVRAAFADAVRAGSVYPSGPTRQRVQRERTAAALVGDVLPALEHHLAARWRGHFADAFAC